MTTGQAFLVEVLGTYILAYVIITCGEHCANRLTAVIAVGSVLFLVANTIGWVSGGGYNPAIAFGIDMADAANHGADRLEHIWIYLIPSMIGGVLAVG